MNATLYLLQQHTQAFAIERLIIPNPTTGFARVSALAGLLTSGPQYMAYSVFDSEENINPATMAAVAAVSWVAFDADADAVLRRVMLIVKS